MALGVLVVTQSPASAHLVGCTLNANNPHISSGLGVVAKANANCTHQHQRLEINPALYRCDYDPGDGRPSENWIFDNCDLVRHEFHSWEPAIANNKYVGQVPAPGSSPVLAAGNYVLDAVFATKQNGVVTGAIGMTSQVVYLNP
jgi:hypothetical protein